MIEDIFYFISFFIYSEIIVLNFCRFNNNIIIPKESIEPLDVYEEDKEDSVIFIDTNDTKAVSNKKLFKE